MTIQNTVKTHLGYTNVLKVTIGEHEGNEVIRITTAEDDLYQVEINETMVEVKCITNGFYFHMATTADKKYLLLLEALKAITMHI